MTTLADQLVDLSRFVGEELDRLAQTTAPINLAPIAVRISAIEAQIRAGSASGTATTDLAATLAGLQDLIASAVARQATASLAPTLTDPLADLAPPRLLVPLDHAGVVGELIAQYRAAATAADMPEMGEFLDLESTPERRLIEAVAYQVVWLEHRINEFYRASLLYFAEAGDLDHAADRFGVTRLTDESDADLRVRTRIRNRGSSAAGPDDWWRFHAMSADEAVEDVAVSRPKFPFPAPGEQRGDVYIAILAETADGIADQAMLDRVTARLRSPAVRPVCTTPVVRAAATRPVTVSANIWLRPDAPGIVFDTLDARFRAAWAKARGLGWNVVRSWVHAALMQPGVQRVELLDWSDVISQPHEAPRLDAVVLLHRGTDF